MELQKNSTGKGLPQNQVVDFHMQQDDTCVQKTLADWLNQQNRLLADTCEESLQCCKRDWLNERGESSRENLASSVLNGCEPSNVTNEITTITDNHNNGYHFDEYIPYIEIESDDDVVEEIIDLTDGHDDVQQRSPGSIDLADNLDMNGTMLTSLLSSYNIVDIPLETSNQITGECINSGYNDDVISLHTDSDGDILSIHVNSSDEVINVELNDTMNDVEVNNMLNNNDDMLMSDGGMCTSILSTFNIVDTGDDTSTENIETNNITDLNDHSFISILSPFCVSNNTDNIEIEEGNEIVTDLTITEDVTTVCNSMLSPVSINDTEKCDIDLTAELASKRRRKKKKKKKKNTPPPHIIRRIIQEKKDKRWKQKLEYEMEEIKKSDIKKEEEDCKIEEICEEISPATTEISLAGRTLATQTVDVYRIAIKDEPDWLKQEND